jgi:hypothetical protein
MLEPVRVGPERLQTLGAPREYTMVVHARNVAAAIRYVVDAQGERMQVFEE